MRTVITCIKTVLIGTSVVALSTLYREMPTQVLIALTCTMVLSWVCMFESNENAELEGRVEKLEQKLEDKNDGNY